MMGVVIGAKPSGWIERPVMRLALVSLAAAVLLAVYWLVAYREPAREDWTLAQLAEAVMAREVTSLQIRGEHVLVETTAGTLAVVRKTGSARSASIADLLQEQGVSQERLSEFPIDEVAPAGPLGWVLKLLLSVPIVILVLGLGGKLINRLQRARSNHPETA